jgi:CBS domain-containing protein
VPGAGEVLLGESRSFLADLFWVNVALGVFNLLPAFPMDGGRAVRAVLAMVTDRRRATRIAAGLGKVMAAVFVALGVLGNPVLALIGVFVWFGASAEGAAADMAQAMRGLTVADAMVTGAQTVRPTDPLGKPVQLLLSGFQQDFPVVDEGERVVGVLTLEALLRALVEQGPAAPISSAMSGDVPAVRPEDDLFDVATRLSRRDRRTLPVVRDGRLVGVLTLENVGELLRVSQALQARPGAFRVSHPQTPPEPRAMAGGPRHG